MPRWSIPSWPSPFHRGVVTAIVVYLVLMAVFGVHDLADPYDEGYVVHAAMRILDGELPYRDFIAGWSPGQFYAVAALFKLFGTTLLVERLYDVAVRAGIVAATYLLTRRLTSPAYALMTALAAGLSLGALGFYAYPVFPALLAVLAAIIGVTAFATDSRRRWLVAAGICTGVATLFRHDLGFYSAVATAAVLSLMAAVRGTAQDHRRFAQARRMVVDNALVAAGIGAAVAPAAWYLLSAVPLGDLWHSLIYLPYIMARRGTYALPLAGPIPVPPAGLLPDDSIAGYLSFLFLKWLPFYFPLAVFALALLLLGRSLLKRPPGALPPASSWAALLVCLHGLLFLTYGLSRLSSNHLFPSNLMMYVTIAWLLKLAVERYAVHGLLARYQRLALALVAVTVLAAGFTFAVRVVTAGATPCPTPQARAGCAALRRDQRDAVAYVRANTAPGEYIFVGNSRHDRIFVNDILFYYLADRPSPTRHHNLLSSVATTAEVQQELIAALTAHAVRHVVTYARFEDLVEPNATSQSSGVTLLDDWVRTHYEPVFQRGVYVVLRLRTAAGSAGPVQP